MRRTDKMGDELNENLREDGLKLGKAALLARIFFLPAAAGLLCLFLLNFLVITSALVSVSVGILCAPIGALYLLGAIGVVSDLSPAALTAAGLFCLCFGCFLCFFTARFSPFCLRLSQRYFTVLKDEKWRRIYTGRKRNRFMLLFFLLSLFALAAAAEAQYLSKKAGFESTVVRDRLVFETAKYLNISTSGLDYELRFHRGDGILVEYVNDTPMIVEQSDVNYLKLVQDDSFTLSLFAREQFGYKMTVWLPENDYREFHLDSGSGDIYISETLSDYTEIRTRSGNITVNGAVGKLSAYAAGGSISCTYAAFVNAGSFETKSGNIDIRIPDFSGIKLEFRTENGYLDSKLLGLKERFYTSLDIEKSAPLSRHLYITTESGGVSVEAVNFQNR